LPDVSLLDFEFKTPAAIPEEESMPAKKQRALVQVKNLLHGKTKF